MHSNPRPSEYESPPLTTEPGLFLILFVVFRRIYRMKTVRLGGIQTYIVEPSERALRVMIGLIYRSLDMV